MAKVTIEIEDLGTGGVAVKMTPLASDLLEKHYKTFDGLTSAESYALFCANTLRDAAKAQEVAASPLSIPGIKKPY